MIQVFIWLVFLSIVESPSVIWLLSYSITLDSIYSMVEYFAKTLTSVTFDFWEDMSMLDRYLYYSLVGVAGSMLYVGTNGFFAGFISLLLSSLGIPEIMKYIRGFTWFRKIETTIKTYLRKQFKRLVCLIFSSILNLICETTLSLHPQISRKEVSLILGDSDLSQITTFIRIFVFTNILSSFENSNQQSWLSKNTIVASVLKTLYNKGQLLQIKPEYRYSDPFQHITNPADKIRAVITNRKLDQFFNPHILLQLLQLYQTKSSSTFHQALMRRVYYWNTLTTRFFAIYMISRLIPYPAAVMAVSMIGVGVSRYRKDRTIKIMSAQSGYDIMYRLVGGILYYLTGNSTTGIIISEYGELLDNSATHLALQTVYKKCGKYYKIAGGLSKLGLEIGATTVYLATISHLSTSIWTRSFLGLCGVAVSQHPVITGILLISGYFSDYHLGHLLIVDGFIFCWIVAYKSGTMTDQVECPLIASYLALPEAPAPSPEQIDMMVENIIKSFQPETSFEPKKIKIMEEGEFFLTSPVQSDGIVLQECYIDDLASTPPGISELSHRVYRLCQSEDLPGNTKNDKSKDKIGVYKSKKSNGISLGDSISDNIDRFIGNAKLAFKTSSKRT